MCIDNDFDKFRNREIRAKDIFDIVGITKPMAYDFVRKYHYLGDAKFFCVYAFGLFYKKTHELVGCATFSLPQGIDALKGWKITGFTKDGKEIKIDTRNEPVNDNIEYKIETHERTGIDATKFERIRLYNTTECHYGTKFLTFYYLDFFGKYYSQDLKHVLNVPSS